MRVEGFGFGAKGFCNGSLPITMIDHGKPCRNPERDPIKASARVTVASLDGF